MSKFWMGAGALFIIGVLTVFTFVGGAQLHVNDLETECRGDRTTEANMQLGLDNSLSFTGYFPVENPNADVTYSYSRSGDSITLNVKSQNLQAPTSFWNTCLASAVYDFDTQSLEDGRYTVTIKHNGERAEKKVISAK